MAAIAYTCMACGNVVRLIYDSVLSNASKDKKKLDVRLCRSAQDL